MNKKNEEIEELQQVSCCGSPVGAIYKRKYGEEQPYMKLGPFKLRLPFIHYRFIDLKFLKEYKQYLCVQLVWGQFLC